MKKLSGRQEEILCLMQKTPALWPDFVDWSHVKGATTQGVRDQGLRQTLWSLQRRGLVEMRPGSDALGDYAPFNAVLTSSGEELARKLSYADPTSGLDRHRGAYHQKDCTSEDCGGTFRCSVCRHTFGWCVGHAGSVELCGKEECPKCDSCCLAAQKTRKKKS